MPMLEELKNNRDKILTLAHEFGVIDVRVIGSVARGEDDERSDIDILINSTYQGDPLGFLDFKHALQEMFNREVDIFLETSIYPIRLAKIRKDAIPI